jgi:hypothetical protein
LRAFAHFRLSGKALLKRNNYQIICTLLAVGFLTLTVLFIVRPGAISELLERVRRIFGLTGEIRFSPGDFEYLSMLTLFGTLSVLAAGSAARPTETIPYIGLVCSKLLGLISFACMAYLGPSIWYVPLVGQATVLVIVLFVRYQMWQYQMRVYLH